MRPEAKAPLVVADEVGVVLRHAAVVDDLRAARAAHALDDPLVDGGVRPDLWRGRLVTLPREGLVTRDFHAIRARAFHPASS
jgi:hypothetical protein